MAGWNGGWVVATHQRMQEADPWTPRAPKAPSSLPAQRNIYCRRRGAWSRMSNCSSRVKCPLHITFALQLQAFRIYRSSGGSNNQPEMWRRRRRCRIPGSGEMEAESNNGRAEISSPASLTTRSIAAARCGKNRDVTWSGWLQVGWLLAGWLLAGWC